MHTSISDNTEALVNYMWMNNTLHFGLRGRQDHMNMLWGDLKMGITSTGREYISFTERATKTRTGAQDPRRFSQRCLYACCIVSSFRLLYIYDNMFFFFRNTYFVSLLLDKTVHFKK